MSAASASPGLAELPTPAPATAAPAAPSPARASARPSSPRAHRGRVKVPVGQQIVAHHLSAEYLRHQFGRPAYRGLLPGERLGYRRAVQDLDAHARALSDQLQRASERLAEAGRAAGAL